MKNYLYMFALLAACLALLAGCSTSAAIEENPNGSGDISAWNPTPYETVNNFPGVAMIVNEETVSSTGLTVTLQNDSSSECIYGEYYGLEKKINGKWYQVPVALDGDYGFEDIGYQLASGEISEWTVNWEWLHGSLDAGAYRIVKYILDFRGTGDFDKYYLAAEFTVSSI